MILQSVVSVISNLNRNCLFHNFQNRNWIRHWNGLFYREGFCDFHNLCRNILLSNQSSQVHKLLACLFQIGEISIYSEIELWLRTGTMNIVDLMFDVLLLLVIEVMKLCLQLFSLLVKTVEVERRSRLLKILI